MRSKLKKYLYSFWTPIREGEIYEVVCDIMLPLKDPEGDYTKNQWVVLDKKDLVLCLESEVVNEKSYRTSFLVLRGREVGQVIQPELGKSWFHKENSPPVAHFLTLSRA